MSLVCRWYIGFPKSGHICTVDSESLVIKARLIHAYKVLAQKFGKRIHLANYNYRFIWAFCVSCTSHDLLNLPSFPTIERLHEQDIIGFFAYFLNLSNFRVAKINGDQWVWYGIATIAKKCYYIWRRIEHLINVSLSNNNYNSCYQASEEFVLPLPYKRPVVLPPGSMPA